MASRWAHAYEPAWAPPGEDGSPGWASPIASASLSWDDLAWIREAAGGVPLLLKGIVRGDDARRALDRGVDGIWVSEPRRTAARSRDRDA